MRYVATIGERTEPVEVAGAEGRYRLTIGEQVWEVDARLTPQGIVSLLVGGVSYVADVTEQTGGAVAVDVGGETYQVQVEEHTRHVIRTRGGHVAGHGALTLTAPLPGKITHVAVGVGDAVQPGDTLLVIEAMKMENEFKAVAGGIVAEVRVAAGQPVNAGDVLLVVQ
jgi:biotin carboxyl carrier protein